MEEATYEGEFSKADIPAWVIWTLVKNRGGRGENYENFGRKEGEE